LNARRAFRFSVCRKRRKETQKSAAARAEIAFRFLRLLAFFAAISSIRFPSTHAAFPPMSSIKAMSFSRVLAAESPRRPSDRGGKLAF
jgi:hypothetical protein